VKARPEPGNGRLRTRVESEGSRDIILLKARIYPEPQLLRHRKRFFLFRVPNQKAFIIKSLVSCIKS